MPDHRQYQGNWLLEKTGLQNDKWVLNSTLTQ